MVLPKVTRRLVQAKSDVFQIHATLFRVTFLKICRLLFIKETLSLSLELQNRFL